MASTPSSLPLKPISKHVADLRVFTRAHRELGGGHSLQQSELGGGALLLPPKKATTLFFDLRPKNVLKKPE
jgi:hypothetical protein